MSISPLPKAGRAPRPHPFPRFLPVVHPGNAEPPRHLEMLGQGREGPWGRQDPQATKGKSRGEL